MLCVLLDIHSQDRKLSFQYVYIENELRKMYSYAWRTVCLQSTEYKFSKLVQRRTFSLPVLTCFRASHWGVCGLVVCENGVTHHTAAYSSLISEMNESILFKVAVEPCVRSYR